MFKKYMLLANFGMMISMNAQINQTAGNNAGDIGVVNFTYQNQTVTYQTVRAADGNEWLQQNLGSSAVATSIDDVNARGDYFQWGRWDDGHQLKNSEMTEEYPNPNNPVGLGSGTQKFYINGGTPWSGNYVGWFANPNQNDTWNAKNLGEISDHNGMDPCKAIGENWEIPTEAIWDNMMQKEHIFPKPDDATNAGIVRGFESNLKIAGAGARKDESFSFEGQRAYIWTKSASANPNFYRYVYLGTSTLSTTGFGGDAKSHGYSIRCVNTSNNSLGVHDFSKERVNIAPNPTEKYFTVYSSSKIKKVEIFDFNGKKLTEQTNIQKIDISEMPKGIYLVKINFEDGKTEIKKVIKK